MAVVGVQIRQAVRDDIHALREVYRRSSLFNEGDRANLLAHPDALELSDIAVTEGRTRLAATAGGRIVGFATTSTAEETAELDDLFVDPDWMRQGIGRALVLDALALARVRGVGRIEVVANPHALPFYERLGFAFDRSVETRFGPGRRMHLDVAP